VLIAVVILARLVFIAFLALVKRLPNNVSLSFKRLILDVIWLFISAFVFVWKSFKSAMIDISDVSIYLFIPVVASANLSKISFVLFALEFISVVVANVYVFILPTKSV